MSQKLPAPEITRRHAEEFFHRTAPVLSLRWPASVARQERLWELPDEVSMVGAAPERFGYHLQRVGPDEYALRLLWNRTCLSWAALSRVQLLSSALAPLLAALGIDLWGLLEQPVRREPQALRQAA